MNDVPKIAFIVGRCGKNKQYFGIRLEEKSRGMWFANRVYSVSETVAKREGHNKSKIAGSFATDLSYPGCPHCRAKGILKCGCGKVACWDGESRTFVCPWCGGKGEVRGQIESLHAGDDL